MYRDLFEESFQAYFEACYGTQTLEDLQKNQVRAALLGGVMIGIERVAQIRAQNKGKDVSGELLQMVDELLTMSQEVSDAMGEDNRKAFERN